MFKQTLIEKINNKKATIGIYGLGYVGLPLVIRFSEVGFKVIGIDIDKSKSDKLNVGASYIKHIPSDNIKSALKNGFEATTDFSRTSEIDALLLCVPTPLSKHREPDLSYIISTIESILPYLQQGQLLSLESTTYPGTTDEEIKPRIESKGFKAGQDIFLVYSPEREDPGNPDFTTKTIPKICGGYSPDCLEVGITLYQSVINQVISVSSTKAAEMTKLLENIYRAVNIGLVNEMKIIADKMGIDIHEVIDAAATKPFGYKPFYPGPGLGGHCIPIDPFYLTWKAREYGIHTRFIELAGEINRNMPQWVVGKVVEVLNSVKKSISGCKILILGIAYKPDVDDMRESPAVELMEILVKKGADIAYSDPYVNLFPKMRNHYFNLKSIKISPDSLAEYDCVVLATNHNSFDYDLIKEHANLIVDSRGVFRDPSSKIIKA